ncbi:uncharacterized protein LODBEIA_P40190 [Lodderomyces beijingensis]|uniref:Uncharacterized protein n=1 Tax=Lodderomyces beijingensis TaxID=1775926 RepID=A0ABP0ZUF2_9ASCO
MTILPEIMSNHLRQNGIQYPPPPPQQQQQQQIPPQQQQQQQDYFASTSRTSTLVPLRTSAGTSSLTSSANSNSNSTSNATSAPSSNTDDHTTTNNSHLDPNNTPANNNNSHSLNHQHPHPHTAAATSNGTRTANNHQPSAATIVPQMISGTGASTTHTGTYTIDPQISSKFTNTDIQILRQLLIAGEKYKWKQITKEINASANHSHHVMAALTKKQQQQQQQHMAAVAQAQAQAQAASNSPLQQQQFGYGGGGMTAGNPAGVLPPEQHHLMGRKLEDATANTPIPLKNVSPTFVMKQYQQLLGFPNNSIYFGILGSSLPYVVAAKGWSEIDQSSYNYAFHTEDD